MFGILMTACVASTGVCTDVVLASQSTPIAANQCMMQAMPEMVEWIKKHEGWAIKSWACGHLNQLKASL